MPKKDIPSIQAMDSKYPPLVEGDGLVTTQTKDENDKVGIYF
jgi:hypothetical protein